MKATHDQMIASLAAHQSLKPVDCAYFTYFFTEPNKKRDPSNFTSGAIKLIEDGLQKAGILKNDGWKNVLGISSYWAVDKSCPGVTLYMTDFEIPTEEANAMMLQMTEEDDDGQE
jgi:hypothetical protein